MAYTGSCLCGEVRYSVVEFEEQIGHCHCSMCRKFHGAAFSTFGSVRLDALTWVAGEEKLKCYVADNASQRYFCDNCGSSMAFCSEQQKGHSLELALSTLDGDVDLVPDAHIYTDYKANWFSVEDDLPKYREYRDGDKIE